jgi:hypothetical protein
MDSMVGRAGRHLLGVSALMLCCLLVIRSASAQETVNYASLSGRVVDPQNAVVPGAHVSTRQTETNIVADTTTDGEGRFRFPYLKVGRYEVVIHLDGFADAKRTVSLTVGSAFDLPIALAVASLDATVTVAAEPPLLETVRSQVAATVTQTEARSLPLNGRNFLDSCAAGSGRVAREYRQHPAFCRNVRRPRAGALDWQPAQLLQQLHRGRFVRE